MSRITVGPDEYEIAWFTGRVASASKHLETIVHSSGGGTHVSGGQVYTDPVRVSSSTVVHDEFFLVHANGTERSFQLQGFDLACREGHEVSVVTAWRKGKQDGIYAYVTNLTTNDGRFDTAAIKKLVQSSPLGCLGSVLAIMYIPLFAHLPETLQGVGILAGFAVTFRWFWVRSKRADEFKSAVMQIDLRA